MKKQCSSPFIKKYHHYYFGKEEGVGEGAFIFRKEAGTFIGAEVSIRIIW